MTTLTRLSHSRWQRTAGWLGSLIIGIGLAAGAVAQTPTVDVSKTTKSLPGPRYTWVSMPAQLPGERDQRVQDPAFRQRLQAALDKALQAKGYRLTTQASQADFVVAYRVGVQDLEEVKVKDIPAPRGGATPQAAVQCSAGSCSQLVTQSTAGQPTFKTSVKHSTEGGLLVEIIEPKTIRVLWRGLERGAVSRGDSKQARLDAIAARALESVPALPR